MIVLMMSNLTSNDIDRIVEECERLGFEKNFNRPSNSYIGINYNSQIVTLGQNDLDSHTLHCTTVDKFLEMVDSKLTAKSKRPIAPLTKSLH